MSKIKVKFFTLGCKTNLYESEAMAELFRKAGHTVVTGKEEADVCVVNTCTVTGTGAQKSRRQIRRVRRENPDAVLAVTGCLAQTDGESIRKELEVDILLGNKYRSKIVEFAEAALQGTPTHAVEDILKEHDFEELGITPGQSRVRANLKIEDGCNNFCTYCIIPYARGPVRSRPMDAIRREAEALGEAGYGEVVLTGIHIGSYGKDLTEDIGLMDVIEMVHRVEGIRRIRLGSLEPVLIDEDFVRRAKALPKLCPQFHMSLQSGCDETLKRMRRHYTADDYRRAVELLRENLPDTAITTDLMVGFAGETREEFAASRDFCKDIGFSQMHIFPYSIRKGTVAEKLPQQVDEQTKAARAHEMLILAAEMKEAFYRSYLGKTLPVLLEQKKNGWYHGTCANYIDVKVKATEDLTGQILPVTLTEYQDEMLIGEL
ncbi:MAG: tRNA (N(6)-L-threonylcarbamoyladenosine(37)-C(2))-methylthiotransferase MtaB [Clostridia bacterium]|nr:tRNA (N(6)-L-threonylcarbamoyladenosine(37)-C(2))-methylthiotransferase MtaB [Clostridia bacterium]